jgi:hypothetical protein
MIRCIKIPECHFPVEKSVYGCGFLWINLSICPHPPSDFPQAVEKLSTNRRRIFGGDRPIPRIFHRIVDNFWKTAQILSQFINRLNICKCTEGDPT